MYLNIKNNHSKDLKRHLLIITLLILMIFVACSVRADAATKGVKSLKNMDSGIKVTWTKVSSATGYHVYRKAEGETSWTMVKTLASPNTVTWTDKKTTDGVKYKYKVFNYKGKKESSNTKIKTMVRLITPKITTLTSTGNKGFLVKAKKNTNVTGFQIKYSLYSSLKKSTTVGKKTKALERKVTGLLKDKKYYVTIRSYKTIDTKKYYSAWTPVKTVKTTTFHYAYTVNSWTYLYKSMSASSEGIKVWYKTELKVYGTAADYSSGKWEKVGYKGKTYYLWTDKGDTKLTTTTPKKYYTSTNYTDYQNAVIRKAFYILRNWDTKYDLTHKTEDGVPEDDGRYAFDCSGFCSYVINTVIQKDCPAFELSASVKGMLAQESIVNEGLTGEMDLITVYDNRETPDFSKLKPGDLIFFDNNDSSDNIDHVGLYVGNKEFIQSTKVYMENPDDLIDGEPAGGVNLAPIKGMYLDDIVCVKRVSPSKVKSADLKMVTTRSVNIYGDSACSTSNSEVLDDLPSGTPVTVMFTLKKGSGVNAYVKYDGGKGFVYKYEDRLEPVEER